MWFKDEIFLSTSADKSVCSPVENLEGGWLGILCWRGKLRMESRCVMEKWWRGGEVVKAVWWISGNLRFQVNGNCWIASPFFLVLTLLLVQQVYWNKRVGMTDECITMLYLAVLWRLCFFTRKTEFVSQRWEMPVEFMWETWRDEATLGTVSNYFIKVSIKELLWMGWWNLRLY